jgi:hypothetical protein
MTVHYESFPLYSATLVGAALCVSRILRDEPRSHLAVFVLFAAASANRIKYLPLFALAAAPLLARDVFPALLRPAATWLASLVRTPPGSAAARRGTTARVLALGFATFALAVPFAIRGAALPTPHRELFEIAGRLANDPTLARAAPVYVLNDANYGGWLELAFWLVRPPGAIEPAFKPAMDNRTLVISQERIRDYDQLRQTAGDWPGILSRWAVRVAILPSRAAIVPALTALRDPTTHAAAWETIQSSNVWTVMVKSGER